MEVVQDYSISSVKIGNNGKLLVFMTSDKIFISLINNEDCDIVTKGADHYDVHPTKSLIALASGGVLFTASEQKGAKSWKLTEYVHAGSSAEDETIVNLFWHKEELIVMTDKGCLSRWKEEEDGALYAVESVNLAFSDYSGANDNYIVVATTDKAVLFNATDFTKTLEVAKGKLPIEVFQPSRDNSFILHGGEKVAVIPGEDKLVIYRYHTSDNTVDLGHLVAFKGYIYVYSKERRAIALRIAGSTNPRTFIFELRYFTKVNF